MFRFGLQIRALVIAGLLSPMIGCRMANPAFDFRETDGDEAAEGEDEAESADEKSDGDGDGVPETGDGDGEPTTGDGDGEPTTGDGDGDNTSDSESDESGDGDGEPIPLDMGVISRCPSIEPANVCQLCAAEKCCLPGTDACFLNGSDCKCVIDCINVQMKPALECGIMCAAEPSALDLYVAFNQCMLSSCDDSCG